MALSNMTEWGQLVIAIITSLVAGTLAYGSVKSDISLLQQKTTYLEQNITEIKFMLREEMERHHPRDVNNGRPD